MGAKFLGKALVAGECSASRPWRAWDAWMNVIASDGVSNAILALGNVFLEVDNVVKQSNNSTIEVCDESPRHAGNLWQVAGVSSATPVWGGAACRCRQRGGMARTAAEISSAGPCASSK